MFKSQCGLTRAVKAVNLNCPIVSTHQDIIYSISNNVISVNAKNS